MVKERKWDRYSWFPTEKFKCAILFIFSSFNFRVGTVARRIKKEALCLETWFRIGKTQGESKANQHGSVPSPVMETLLTELFPI